ncbi:hypothetical protein CPAR01_13884 [Colletotrichum paranaense]|uniref:RRM domain-containing protein n=1 Tax=Colletotrichum paranaense TaxID=1914294 RepID=A0ABQ9S2J3_9PEZI|nr:uncharacterized protein CPAR01_13884 [Colletotrichum paranaense]KAK1523031.1 hypothetical protein CPAR01_13884 [Colletotrichum paranaense]
MAFNGSRGIEANDKDDQERFDIVLAPYRKNRRLLRVKNLPFAETRARVEAFLNWKLAKPDSASFNWPPSNRPSGHDGVVFVSFRERNDCVRADRDLKVVMYPGPRGTRELIVQIDRGRNLAIPAAAWHRLRNSNAANSAAETPEKQMPHPVSSTGPTVEVSSLSRAAQQRKFHSPLAVPTDAERMRLTQEFFTNEMKIRSERYGNDGGVASEISGAVVPPTPLLSSPAPARKADEISSSGAPTVLTLNPRPANSTGTSSRTDFQTWKAFVGALSDSDDDDENNVGARLGYD